MNLSSCGPDEPLASPVPYCQTSPRQRAQAKDYLQHRLRLHFPTLAESTWAATLDSFQPDLWVGRERVTLAAQDLTSLTQYLARSPELPVLDPPIYGEHTLLLAQQHLYLAELAVWVLSELEAGLSSCGPRLYALVSRLARGNGMAEQVVQATRWGLAVGRPLPAGIPGGGNTPGSLEVERRLLQVAQRLGLALS